MLQQIGKIAVSLMVTNWIYAEAVLLIPQIDPLARRIMHVMRIPTHKEWPGIMHSPDAAVLARDVNVYLSESSLRSAFVAVGVLDARAKAVARRGIKSLREGYATRSAPDSQEYEGLVGGSRLFDSVDSRQPPPGYEHFGFDV